MSVPKQKQPDPKEAYWPLILGLAFVGAAVGFVIGASETPVAGVVVGPLLALIPIGLEALKARSNRAHSIAIQKVADSAASEDARKQLTSSLGDAPAPTATAAQLGAALIFVAVGFLAGTVGGGLARVRNWYGQAAVAPAALPWDASTPKDCVLTAESMADFITMRRGLMDAGFSADQTNRIFELGRDRWCKAPPSPPSPLQQPQQPLQPLPAPPPSVKPSKPAPPLLPPPG